MSPAMTFYDNLKILELALKLFGDAASKMMRKRRALSDTLLQRTREVY